MVLPLFFYQHGLWLSWPLLVLGLFVIWVSIATLVGMGEKNRLVTLPLAPQQVVEFDDAGRVELWLEGPLLRTRFSGLSFELAASDGSLLKGHRSWGRHHSSSFSRARVVARLFTVPKPGRYILRTSGLGAPQPSDEDHHILFMRPYLAQTVACVLGILFGAFLAIGSIVNFLLRRLSARSH